MIIEGNIYQENLPSFILNIAYATNWFYYALFNKIKLLKEKISIYIK